MPRIARVVAVGEAHHITQRGNYRQKIFRSNKDREQYLAWIKEYSDKFGLSVLAYCLMNNHIHLIAVPGKEDALSKTLNNTHMRYAQYFNKKLKAKGHLWQGRFYSCVLDNRHLLAAAKYVERNPVRAGLVKQPWEWKWSSSVDNVAGKTLLFDYIELGSQAWKDYTMQQDEKGLCGEIRAHTQTGRPLCDCAFIAELEKKLDRKLIVRPRGRPRVAAEVNK